jgi:hypothetical protein
MPIADLETLHYKLGKRGFRRDDVLLHICDKCGLQAVLTYLISGKVGGRDIRLCAECGHARSWRNAPDGNTREEDLTFDLVTFLK